MREYEQDRIYLRTSNFFDPVTNPNKIVKNVDICRENLLLVNWDDTESSVEPHACSNVIVAAFVTVLARLKLYGILEKLNERILYFDTDSIIIITNPIYGTLLLSTTGLENRQMKCPMLEL